MRVIFFYSPPIYRRLGAWFVCFAIEPILLFKTGELFSFTTYMELCAVTTYNPTPAMYVVNRESPYMYAVNQNLKENRKTAKTTYPSIGLCIEPLIDSKYVLVVIAKF